MAIRKTVEEEISQIHDLKDLMSTLESIAALYMRRVKQSVVESRIFYDGLSQMYEEVEGEYDVRSFPHRFTRIKSSFSGLIKKRRAIEAVVLLSVNSGLYGDVIEKTFRLFLMYVHTRGNEVDIIIVGSRGRLFFEELMPHVPYEYHDYPDTKLDQEKFITLVRVLARYERVHIFYGKFESFISQIAAESFLGRAPVASPPASRATADRGSGSRKKEPSVMHLFEPSREDVTHFFQTEIFVSLFEQVLHESHLAKLASRMFMLDGATVNAERLLGEITFLRQKIIHQDVNKRQLSVISSRIALNV